MGGTRIKVSQDRVRVRPPSDDADQIIEAHPHLSLADVHAALTYYYDDRDTIHAEWREAQALIDALRNGSVQKDLATDFV